MVRLGRRLVVLADGGIDALLLEEDRAGRLGPGAASTSNWIPALNVATSAAQYLAFTWLLLTLRDALRRERSRATEDPLTGLLNRRAFTEALTQEITPPRRFAARRAVARAVARAARDYVDLDGFKAVNDTAGHDAADAVLRLAAEALRGAVRAGDLVARLGGGEFALWLPGAGAADARGIAERALVGIRAESAHKGWPVGASFGEARDADTPADAATAIRAADALMYHVKRGGKGRVHVLEVPPVAAMATAAGPNGPAAEACPAIR